MSYRLNKAIRELNIGLQTAVEFLEKRTDLGEVRADLNFKLSDTQYEALVKQFKKDKEVKGLADKLFAQFALVLEQCVACGKEIRQLQTKRPAD